MRLLLVLLAACSTEVDTSSGGLPCDVATVLETRCAKCHADPPKFAAPMPLAAHDHLLAPARSNGSLRVIDVLPSRIAADSPSPMPPVTDPPLSVAERAVLETWVAGGAPRSNEQCEQVREMPEPTALPCGEPTHRFVAHAVSDPLDETPFAVAADSGNSMRCFAFRVPDEQLYLRAAAPIIDDARVLHHWILWGSDRALEDGSVFDCNGNMPGDAQFLTGWAPGGGVNVFPDGVALALPEPGGTFILQVHYWNGMELDGIVDRSGVALCADTTPPEHVAAVHTLGTVLIDVPAHGTQTVTGWCAPQTTEPIQILASGPHMHRLGTAIRTEILRGGSEANMEMLVEVDPWDFDDQGRRKTETTLFPGDVLRTTCEYSNPTANPVRFGEDTEDEMCFNFVVAYPGGSLVGGPGAYRNACIEFSGP